MKRFKKIVFKSLCLLLLIPHIIHAQNVELNTTSLQIVDKKLEISYDILNDKRTQRFDVSVEITDSKGMAIEARSYSGDVGKNQKGGKDKYITWDYNADEIILNETVHILLKAESSMVEGAVNTGNNFLKSTVLPGWGLSSVDKGKPYWLLGVTFYGSITASIIFKVNSNNNYDKYKSTFDPDLSTDYFNKSQSQASTSTVFIYTAVGTWLATGIWTIIKANNINNSLTAQNRNQKLNFCSQYDPVSKTSGFKLVYNFN